MIITGIDRFNVHTALGISSAKVLVEVLRAVLEQKDYTCFVQAAEKVGEHGFNVTDTDAVIIAESLSRSLGQVVDTYRILSREEVAELERREALEGMLPASEVAQ
jgi:hypothetical protein